MNEWSRMSGIDFQREGAYIDYYHCVNSFALFELYYPYTAIIFIEDESHLYHYVDHEPVDAAQCSLVHLEFCFKQFPRIDFM